MLFFLAPPLVAQEQERKLKPGDAIEIVVYEHEELSETVVVDSLGMIESPFLRGVQVDGLTLEAFQNLLVTQLSRYLEKSPLVRVRIIDGHPIKVTVLGRVENPGQYTLPNTATLQGAIGEAGGYTSGAQLSAIKLHRKEAHGRTTQVVNMEKFYEEGDPAYLPGLENEDTIVVPGVPFSTAVKVMGSVNQPGSYDVYFRASILDVIFLAGGPTDEANLKEVKIVSHAEKGAREERVNVNDLMKQKGPDVMPMVLPGDIVYVPKKAMTWTKFVRAMRDVSTFATLFLIIRYGRKY